MKYNREKKTINGKKGINENEQEIKPLKVSSQSDIYFSITT